jgi:hypothetical protein
MASSLPKSPSSSLELRTQNSELRTNEVGSQKSEVRSQKSEEPINTTPHSPGTGIIYYAPTPFQSEVRSNEIGTSEVGSQNNEIGTNEVGSNTPPLPHSPTPSQCLFPLIYTPECVDVLTEMAITNSPKIKSLREKITLVEERVAFLEEKIDYNQDRQWTDYITLDPIKLVQNIFGGGDVQRTRLTIADLETKTSALSFDLVQLEQAIENEKSVLREKIYNLLLEIQDNTRQVQLIESQLETFKKQKEIFKIQYAGGEGTTNQYLGLQDKEDKLNDRLLDAQIKRDKAKSNLFEITGVGNKYFSNNL